MSIYDFLIKLENVNIILNSNFLLKDTIAKICNVQFMEVVLLGEVVIFFFSGIMLEINH